MSLQFIEGAAGTGKTTQLLEVLCRHLSTFPLTEGQRVLALTKMHGSRRRLEARLTSAKIVRGQFECVTVDSFAARILGRWRNLAKLSMNEIQQLSFEEVCERAAALLQNLVVAHWICARFPVGVLDEGQDCKGGQLGLVKALSQHTTWLVAADDFQDLDTDGPNELVGWARASTMPLVLSAIHRTNESGLLNAAVAIRNGQAVYSGKGFKLQGVPKAPLGAWHVAKLLTIWHAPSTVAVISPAGVGKSPFVRELTDRLGKDPIGKNPKFGPFRLHWAGSTEFEIEEQLKHMGMEASYSGTISLADLRLPNDGFGNAVTTWFARKKSLSGVVKVDSSVFRTAVTEIVRRTNAYGRSRRSRVSALTIHQAKNQEFDRVIVLWPFQIAGNAARHRRLLYNAITRAKHEAVVLVQDEKRLGKPPFAAD